jgi:hypothetical protein
MPWVRKAGFAFLRKTWLRGLLSVEELWDIPPKGFFFLFLCVFLRRAAL